MFPWLFIYLFIYSFLYSSTYELHHLKKIKEKLRREPSWPALKFYPTLILGTEEKQVKSIIPFPGDVK